MKTITKEIHESRKLSKGVFTSSFLVIATLLLFIAGSVSGQSFILDQQYNPMSFTNAQRTILVNTGNSGKNAGSVHKYSNVSTVDGVVVYAHLTILERNNAGIVNFDDDVQTGDPNRFQPRLSAGNNGGYVLYELEFFNTANDESVFLYNYWLTGVDVDGSSYYNGYREYAEIGGYTSYQLDATTQLTVSTNQTTGRTRFTGRQGSLSGVTFDNTASYIANFSNPNNKITFALGITDDNDERYFSVQLGGPDPDGPFDNPVVVNNPLPIAVDDVGTPLTTTTGGIAVPNVLDNDLYNGAPVVPTDVTITEITPASDPGVELNENTGEVTVAPGTPPGEYTIIYQICMVAAPGDCDVATITVTVLPPPVGPTAVDDQATTPMNTPVTIDVLSNDTEGDAALDPTDVSLVGTQPDPNTEGSFSVDPVTGEITFTPVNGFTGQVTGDYQVCDENDLCSTATITVDVTPVAGPTAVDDETSTPMNTPVDINVLANDTPGAAPLDPTSITFDPNTAPDPNTEGSFTVHPTTGLVTFTPVSDFTGDVSIDYEVCDDNAQCATATITVHIINTGTDTDGDGCNDDVDDYPNDPTRCFDNWYPAGGDGTLAYEDLWPGKGDYDFNDLVLDYRFNAVTNGDNKIVEIFGNFTIRAFGAGYENGFGFQLANDQIAQTDLTVTGAVINGSYVTLDQNGLEDGQSKPTVIVYDNAFDLMPHPGQGIGVNTTLGAPYVEPVTVNIHMGLGQTIYTLNQLDIANFNPFIMVNQDRGVEVHLPDYEPTDLADPAYFTTFDDDSDAGSGRYYKTANNLPWAIHIPESFDYPIEKQDIIWVHLKFAEWAQSNGVDFQDWYKDEPGYRNNGLIYTHE